MATVTVVVWVVAIGLLLLAAALRVVVLWYLRVPDRIARQDRMIALLERIDAKLDGATVEAAAAPAAPAPTEAARVDAPARRLFAEP